MRTDKNKELMLAAGSKTGAYDVEAPDQWKWVLRHGERTEKGMAWVKSKTTAFNHESPFCVDEHGNALYASHMAVECGWEEQTARNVLAELQSQGRVRLDESRQAKTGKRIWYCADVPQAYEKDGLKNESHNSVHSCETTYVVDFIESLPDEKRATAKLKLEACFHWKREFIADGMAALRAIADRVEDNTLREIGIPKKRLPKRRPAKCKWVQLSLLAEPDFVQSCEIQSVQTADSGSYKPKTETVQSKNGGASFSVSTTTTTQLASESAPGAEDVAELQQFLHDVAAKRFPRLKPPTPNKQTCINLLRMARAKKPDAVSIEIAEAVASFAAKNTGFETWGGVVDLLRKSWSNGEDRAAPAVGAPKCWSCGKPITGTAINGACFDCIEARRSQIAGGGD